MLRSNKSLEDNGASPRRFVASSVVWMLVVSFMVVSSAVPQLGMFGVLIESVIFFEPFTHDHHCLAL